jgi:biotin transport system substrate-specific component
MTINASSRVQTSQVNSWLKELMIVLGASVIIALFAPISIPLPFSPVPIATQAHVILFLAALLGSRRGSLAVLAFLFQGAMGLPVFSGAKGGLWVLAGPTGGYLLGYLAAAFLTGYLVERMRDQTAMKTFGAMAAGNGVIYLFGLPWLAQFVGWQGAFLLGLLPFVIGDALKLVVSTKALKRVL